MSDLSKMSVGELENLDRLTVRALEFGEGLSAEDRRRLDAERRLIRAEIRRRHAAEITALHREQDEYRVDRD
jgi:hypothetical protein